MRVIDAAVHPAPRDPETIRRFMQKPWSTRAILPPVRHEYPVPTGEYWPPAAASGGDPGTDPAALRSAVLGEDSADAAILLPFTRGLLPDVGLSAAVCRATNDWLATEWLDPNPGAFFGSIRVDPRDPAAAIEELERRAGDPRFVQVAVPLESHHPYGQRAFEPLWAACAAAGFPVAIMSEGGGGIELQPTTAGYPRYFAEYGVLQPLNYHHHLLSLVVEGVLERLPQLRVVFVDGGSDIVMPMLWRTDKDWRAIRFETPWVKRPPSEYVFAHCRFCVDRLEGPTDPERWPEWATIGRAGDLCVYGSRYPRWNYQPPADAMARVPEPARTNVMTANAAALYSRLSPAASRGNR